MSLTKEQINEALSDASLDVFDAANKFLSDRFGREATLWEVSQVFAMAYGASCGLLGAQGATVQDIAGLNNMAHLAAQGAMSGALAQNCAGSA